MKSERRHELETNQLAQSLANLPELMRLYGSRILLAVTLVILVAVFVYTRVSTGRTAAAEAVNTLAFSRERLSSLRHFEPLALNAPEDRRDTFRSYVQDVNDALDVVVRNTDDATLLAEALVARGDLNWLIATYPELPEATTRPALQLSDNRQAPLNIAFESYSNVLNAYADQDMPVLSARFGLAAIAENRGEWDAARTQYQAIADSDRFPDSFREEARSRIEQLDEVSQPILVVDAPPAAPADDANAGDTSAADTNTDDTAAVPATQPAATEPAVD